MAKVVNAQIPAAWQPWAQSAIVGVIVGAIFAVVTALLSRYVIEPLACGTGDAVQCAGAVGLSAHIATVLAAAAGIALGIRFAIFRPLFVGIAAAMFLWGFGDWTAGLFWLEILGWALLLYAITYALFAWIARSFSLIIVLGLTLIIIVVERIVLAL